MSGTTDLRAALIARLLAIAPGAAVPSASVAWENKKYIPIPGTRYYRATFLPGIPRPSAIGQDAQNRQVGIFQIDIFDPPDKGDALAATEAERIAACYKRGTALSYNGQALECIKAYRTAGNGNDPAWYMVSVVVEFFADVSN